MIWHRIFLGFLLLGFLSLGFLLLRAEALVASRSGTELPALGQIVRVLQLTDLSIWTEARYTRHPSQADRFTPFQDFPSALEHFPAGSIIPPGGGGSERRDLL